MKTKKAILEWFKSEGNRIGYKDCSPIYDDITDFNNRIDKSIRINTEYNLCKNPKVVVTILNSKRWKYPLELFWLDKECIKISGF